MKTIIFTLILFCQCLAHAKIYDCFTFFNEIELLKIRLDELYDVVDHFIIVEGRISFTGKEKPLYFAENAQQFEKYKDKIIHIVIDSFPGLTGEVERDHWWREEYSRNAILQGLKGCDMNDIILISDLDEIPSKNAIHEIEAYLTSLPSYTKIIKPPRTSYVCDLHMRLFMFQMNRESPQGWSGGAKACPYWMVEKYSPWGIKLFHHKYGGFHIIQNGGWHFNTMGGKELALYKWLLTGPLYDNEPNLLEQGRNPDLLEKNYQAQVDYHTKVVPIDDTFPKYFLEHLDHFSALGWIADY